MAETVTATTKPAAAAPPGQDASTPLLRVKNLDINYGESQVLRDVNLELNPGTITALMGRNGVGKTTLLKAIMGLLQARKGEVAFQGKSLNGLPPEKRARAGIAYVPQGREIFPKLTIEENLLMGLEARPQKPGKLPEEEMFSLFPFLTGMRKRLGGNLSGGQQQQLAIARALLGKPKILLLDEPTEGIQPSIIDDIEKVLFGLKAKGDIAILLVEQYLDFARRLGDRYYIMERGTMVQGGKTSELTEESVKKYLAF
ncbi:MAG TPA: urea ABC transporter ATP-binding subunit UrtE [Fibrobacteria bacterium]|nr:urea ABC transporter ATP-binding subunit UrtE [Fibrobacteria bacterium]